MPDAQIRNAAARVFAAADARDWTALAALMMPSVRLDYASFGGVAADVTPDEIVAAWRGFLPGFDATHHQIGNLDVTVENDAAQASCYGTAGHFIAGAAGGEVWTVVGTYDLGFLRRKGAWKLSSLVFRFKYQTGNAALAALAQSRAA